jgi:23S rRNA pseudouridine2605 synthase
MTLQYVTTGIESLARRISLSGLLSRREAEKAILTGLVTVDGRTITKGCKVPDSSTVVVEGIHNIPPPPPVPRLWGLIKPRGVISDFRSSGTESKSLSDMVSTWNKKQTKDFGSKALELENINPRISNLNHFIVINKISTMATGLVLLTTDSVFASTLTREDAKILTTYRIRTPSILDSTLQQIRTWKNGVSVAGTDFGPVFIDVEKRTPTQTWLRVRLVSTNERTRGLDDLFWFRGGVRVNRVNVTAFGPYKASDVSERSVVPLPIDASISHLVPQRDIKPTLVRIT